MAKNVIFNDFTLETAKVLYMRQKAETGRETFQSTIFEMRRESKSRYLTKRDGTKL